MHSHYDLVASTGQWASTLCLFHDNTNIAPLVTRVSPIVCHFILMELWQILFFWKFVTKLTLHIWSYKFLPLWIIKLQGPTYLHPTSSSVHVVNLFWIDHKRTQSHCTIWLSFGSTTITSNLKLIIMLNTVTLDIRITPTVCRNPSKKSTETSEALNG